MGTAFLHPFLSLSALLIGASIFSGCDLSSYIAGGSFNRTTPFQSSQSSASSVEGSTPQSSVDCTAVLSPGSGDPCFAQDGNKNGAYSFTFRPSNFSLKTHVGPEDGSNPFLKTVLTAVDEEESLYVLNSLKPSASVGFELNKLSTRSADQPIWKLAETGDSTLATAFVVGVKQAGIRHIYVAMMLGTLGSPSRVSVCRYREDFSQFFPVQLDMFSGFGNSGCTHIYDPDMGGAPTNDSKIQLANSVNFKPAHTHPMQLAFIQGSDGAQRVILSLTVDDGGVQKVLLVPIRTSDGKISTPGSPLGAASIQLFAVQTSNEGSTFAISGAGTARALRTFALETDRDVATPSAAFLGVQFENPVLSAANGGGNRVEHLIYKIKSDLTLDPDFGGNLQQAIYVPAEGTGLPMTVVRVNTKPESDALSLPVLKVSNHQLYLAGLHGEGPGPTGSMGYKLLRFSVNATDWEPDASSHTTLNSMCSRKATPTLATQSNSAGLLFACSQDHSASPSTPDNVLVRAHDGINLSNSSRYSNSCGNGGLCIEGAFDNLSAPGTFSPSVQLYYDTTRAQWLWMTATLFPNALGDHYPHLFQAGY